MWAPCLGEPGVAALMLLSSVSWLLCRLPAPVAGAFAWCSGWLLYHVLRLRRRVARENLARALPELDRRAQRRLLRGHYGHLGRVLIDTLRLPLLTKPISCALLGDALGQLERLRRGRGLIVVVGHLGLWDRLACAAALAGLPVSVVTRRIKRGSVDRFWQRLRARCGVQLLPAEGSALALRRRLRAGELVALAIDQHQPGGLETTFFDRPVLTSAGAARLSLDSGAPIVVASLTRCGSGLELQLDQLRDTAGLDAQGITQLCNDTLEQQVRQRPEQWFWVHRRWKNVSKKQDDGDSSPDPPLPEERRSE
jgi:KDO2-lipid IV(A) lauroyltransferase